MKETFYKVGCPAKIALLTDLHDHPCKGLLPSLKRQRPDLICVAGDFILGFHPDSRKAADRYLKWHQGTAPGRLHAVRQIRYALHILAACTKIAPTYVSLGNHEWMFTKAELRFIEKTGVTLLDNSWTRHGDIVIGGLTAAAVTEYRYFRQHPDEAPLHADSQESVYYGMRRQHEWITRPGRDPQKIYPDRSFTPLSFRPHPETAWLQDFAAQDGYKILLCHHPEYRDRYLKDLPIDLVLSGHAHGGQIRIAGQGLFAPGQGFFPYYTSGVHGNMVISRGLSNTASFIPRLGNPTEVIYLV